MILLGYAGPLRPGEIAALTMADLQPQRDGVLIRIQAAQDRLAAGPFHPTSDGTCRAQGHSPLPLRAITANAASDIVHERAAAGLDATRITGHATTAALAGVVLHRMPRRPGTGSSRCFLIVTCGPLKHSRSPPAGPRSVSRSGLGRERGEPVE